MSATFNRQHLKKTVRRSATDGRAYIYPHRLGNSPAARTREVRAGKYNDPRFGTRQTGEGHYADSISQLFDKTARRLGLTRERSTPVDVPTTFRRPGEKRQLDLFGR